MSMEIGFVLIYCLPINVFVWVLVNGSFYLFATYHFEINGSMCFGGGTIEFYIQVESIDTTLGRSNSVVFLAIRTLCECDGR